MNLLKEYKLKLIETGRGMSLDIWVDMDEDLLMFLAGNQIVAFDVCYADELIEAIREIVKKRFPDDD